MSPYPTIKGDWKFLSMGCMGLNVDHELKYISVVPTSWLGIHIVLTPSLFQNPMVGIIL